LKEPCYVFKEQHQDLKEQYHVMGDTNSPQKETHTGCLIFASQFPQKSLKIVADLWKAT